MNLAIVVSRYKMHIFSMHVVICLDTINFTSITLKAQGRYKCVLEGVYVGVSGGNRRSRRKPPTLDGRPLHL